MQQSDTDPSRDGAMRHLVIASGIARALTLEDRTMLALSFARVAMELDKDTATWAIQPKPWLQ
jgi:hypothetical protein